MSSNIDLLVHVVFLIMIEVKLIPVTFFHPANSTLYF